MEKTLVVTPTYNEADNIEKFIGQVLSQGPSIEMLIVDDNSPDGTAAIVERLMETNPRIHILKRPGKMGLGTAYVDGFRYAIREGYDFIFEMDADFSHNPEEIPRFLGKAKEFDLVIGSRYTNGVRVVNWPIRRLLLSYAANVYTRVITGMPIKDATGGLQVLPAEGARIDRPRPGPLERVRVPDRDELQGVFQGFQALRTPDHLRRPGVGPVQDVQENRLRGGLHGLETEIPEDHRDPLTRCIHGPLGHHRQL